MNVATAFHQGDLSQVLDLLKWCAELGVEPKHDLFLMPAKGMNFPPELLPLARKSFRKVELVPDAEGVTSDWQHGKKDASGPNSMFRQFAWHFYLQSLGPWLFWEPDAILLYADCLDKLEAEYRACGKPFMGSRIVLNGVPHMSGNAIYPQDTIGLAPSALRFSTQAFDFMSASDVLPKMHETKLIAQVFSPEDDHTKPPTFPNQESLSIIPKEAVLFHRCKDGSLIQRLREQNNLSGGVESRHARQTDVKSPSNGEIHLARERGSGSSAPPAQSLLCKHPNTESRSVVHAGNGVSATSENSACGNESAAVSPDGASEKLSNIVHTYYDPVPGMDTAEQEWLLARWAMSWKAHGWIPKVISKKEAALHPAFAEWEARFKSFPTVNAPEYELACWLRWVAMVMVGGNLITDYDVLNYGFTPNDCEIPDGDFPALLSDKNPNPGVILGTAKQYEDAVIFMAQEGGNALTIEHGKPHASDQNFVQKFADRFTVRAVCWEHGREEAKTAKLIHYSHSSCGGRPRSEVIPTAEALRDYKPFTTFSDRNETARIAKANDKREAAVDLSDVARQKPQPEIEKIREHISVIQKWMEEKPSRKNVLRAELRKAGFLREAKKRKVRKSLL